MKLTRKARGQARHGRATVLQQAAARVDPTDPAWRARNQRRAEKLRRQADGRTDD